MGTTRFGNIEFWIIPPGRTSARPPGVPHAVEIGWTWLAPDAQRTAVNTEAKRLMLAHAFERWEVLRVSLKTDARNVSLAHAPSSASGRGWTASCAPTGRRGPRAPATTAYYSMLAREWPDARARLDARLARGAGPAT